MMAWQWTAAKLLPEAMTTQSESNTNLHLHVHPDWAEIAGKYLFPWAKTSGIWSILTEYSSLWSMINHHWLDAEQVTAISYGDEEKHLQWNHAQNAI